MVRTSKHRLVLLQGCWLTLGPGLAMIMRVAAFRIVTILAMLLAAAGLHGCGEKTVGQEKQGVAGAAAKPTPPAEPTARTAPPSDPADKSLTRGYDAATQRVTAPLVVLDLAQPATGNYPAWVSRQGYPGLVRAATHQRITTGGYFGRGFSRFSPGHVVDHGRGEHYCGVGQIHGFDQVGDSSKMVIGQLIRFGTTFFTDQSGSSPPYGDIKQIVLLKDSGPRPMMITRGNTRTRVLAPGNGTVCNTTDSKDKIDYFNDGNHEPNLNRYLGQWLWIEFAINTHEPFLRVRTWSEDGSLKGAETIAPWGEGGQITALDIIGFVNSIPKPGAEAYYDLERIEFRVGTDQDITPPKGFPGSRR